jgi:hypothetical protein
MRLRAVEQVQAGAHPEDVAPTLGLHRKTWAPVGRTPVGRATGAR